MPQATSVTAEQGFARLVTEIGDRPGVEVPGSLGRPARRFGSSGLLIHGRIFAMLSQGRLVLKLPARRVAELIGSGMGSAYDAGKGRPMREWVGLDPTRHDCWLALATEAMDFVAAAVPPRRR